MAAFSFPDLNPRAAMFTDLFNNVPLVALAGISFGFVQQAFKYVWRLAEVEGRTKANSREITRVETESIERHEKLVDQLECLPRIEVRIEQLFDERKSVIRSSTAAG